MKRSSESIKTLFAGEQRSRMIEISREVQVVAEEALVAERGREYVFKASAGGRQAVLPRLTIRELAKGRDVVLFSQQSEAME